MWCIYNAQGSLQCKATQDMIGSTDTIEHFSSAQPKDELIKSRMNNFCMRTHSAMTEDNTPLVYHPCEGLNNEKFLYDHKSRLIEKNSGKCIDATDNVLVLKTCSDSKAQMFEYDSSKEQWMSMNSGRCIDIDSGSTAANTKLIQKECNNGINQKWYV